MYHLRISTITVIVCLFLLSSCGQKTQTPISEPETDLMIEKQLEVEPVAETQSDENTLWESEILWAQEQDDLDEVDEMPQTELILEAEIPPATYIDENGNELPLPEIDELPDDGNDFPQN